jgi:hypothetical protein
MNAFAALNYKTRNMIVGGTVFLLVISFSLLIFGENAVSRHHDDLIHQAKESVRADMLYSHPGEGGH